MKSIYDIDLNSADMQPNFLQQYKGKVTLVVNTTVGCGNANQLEVLQWLQDKYGGDNFQIVAIPTNDYCGVGITKGKWSQGITCGLDSKKYGEEVYNTTFQYSEMISSNPNELVSESIGQEPGHNGLGQPYGEPHDLYKEIQLQQKTTFLKNLELNIKPKSDFMSPWLNNGFDNGEYMGGNYEKYLIDKDGYVVKHFPCTMLNYGIEKTLKEALEAENIEANEGEGRSQEIFDEEYSFICNEIEKCINGELSPINPNNNL